MPSRGDQWTRIEEQQDACQKVNKAIATSSLRNTQGEKKAMNYDDH